MVKRHRIAFALLLTVAAGAAVSLFVSRDGLHVAGKNMSDAFLTAAAESGVPIKSPVLVIAPGTELVAGDRHVQAFGFDSCPQNEGIMRWLFGPGLDGNACIRLDREHVRVWTHDRTGTDKKEVWTVLRAGDQVSLASAAGEPIKRAD